MNGSKEIAIRDIGPHGPSSLLIRLEQAVRSVAPFGYVIPATIALSRPRISVTDIQCLRGSDMLAFSEQTSSLLRGLRRNAELQSVDGGQIFLLTRDSLGTLRIAVRLGHRLEDCLEDWYGATRLVAETEVPRPAPEQYWRDQLPTFDWGARMVSSWFPMASDDLLRISEFFRQFSERGFAPLHPS